MLQIYSSKYSLDIARLMHYHQTSDENIKTKNGDPKAVPVYFEKKNMRTTLNIEEDVLLAAKEIARQ